MEKSQGRAAQHKPQNSNDSLPHSPVNLRIQLCQGQRKAELSFAAPADQERKGWFRSKEKKEKKISFFSCK
jgi:hypothetical protein